MDKTITVFKKFPDGSIIALFPEKIMDRRGNCVSYMHIGQHGAADPNPKDTVAAKPSEYADLQAELEGQIGYALDIRPEVTDEMDSKRLAALRDFSLAKYD